MCKITFNELRRIKDALPEGAVCQIARELNVEQDTVRNYFGGTHYKTGEGQPQGVHIEPGPDGGIVALDDDTILNKAKEIIASCSK